MRPEPVPTLDPKGEYLTRAWQERVYPLAKKMGIPMKMPPVQPRSRLAHQAAHWARSLGHFEEYNDDLFRAFFERGEDIGQANVLLHLASELRLDIGALDTALLCGEFLQAVVNDERDAERIGIRAVPSFVAGRKAMASGVQPVSSLRNLLNKAAS